MSGEGAAVAPGTGTEGAGEGEGAGAGAGAGEAKEKVGRTGDKEISRTFSERLKVFGMGLVSSVTGLSRYWSGSTSSVPADKRVVIIGGGYAGKNLASSLIKRGSNVTIIDKRDAFQHSIASVRTYVDKSYAENLFIPYSPTFGAHYCNALVRHIDTAAKTILMEGTEGSDNVLPYDTLIIATGCKGPLKEWELSREECVKQYNEHFDAVAQSNKIVIVGGGPSGVEKAGEIASTYPKKRVTIIHAHDRLVGKTTPDNFNKRLTALLAQCNIETILGERVVNLPELADGVHGSYKVKTSNGNVVDADMVIFATGLTINSAAFASSLSEHMEPNGALRVNEFLQVEGFQDIFALGDCSNLVQLKTVDMAVRQATYLATNLPRYLKGMNMCAWEKPKYRISVSVGRAHGVAVTYGGWLLPEFLVVYYKSRKLMVDQYYKEMNQPVPAVQGDESARTNTTEMNQLVPIVQDESTRT